MSIKHKTTTQKQQTECLQKKAQFCNKKSGLRKKLKKNNKKIRLKEKKNKIKILNLLDKDNINP